MPTITIQQTGQEAASPFSARVSFDHGESVPVTITDPFNPGEEERLAWYFEKWLAFPFIDAVKAKDAAQSVNDYGEALFRQVFSDPEVFATYAEMRADLADLVIEIKGTAAFHVLHWEALKDPKLDRALSLDAILIRRNTVKQVIKAKAKPSPTINVLVVTARPHGAGDVSYRTISRPLLDTLERAGLRVRVDILRPATYRSLIDHLERARQRHGAGHYHVIHFDVHGSLLTFDQFDRFEAHIREARPNPLTFQPVRYGRDKIAAYDGQRGFLFLEAADDAGLPVEAADPVEAGELARLLQTHRIPVAILNACQSAMQVGGSETSVAAELVKAGMQFVVAMGYSVTVSAAEKFMAAFYGALFDAPDAGGGDPTYAVRRARQALRDDKRRRAHFNQTIALEDWLLPVVHCNDAGARLATRAMTPEESDAYFQRKAARYDPQEPQYGFFGRDLDILNIERRVLARNLLLVRGMGGAGKSALLRHLAAWWQRTGFVDEVFYFGWDSRAWNRQQILHAIAERLLPPGEFSGAFLPMAEEAQQAYLAERLRGARHLLILDNLESITGAHLAIKNTLPEAEQQRLRALLRSLAGGRTIVLLGSRGPEAWLLEGLPADTYDLPGLDPEAASGLADAVLRRHAATRYREDPDLRELLKLLAGYPLPIEVVLASLARQAPAEALAALRDGLASLDTGSADKTESLLACVDYSFGNLADADQRLLLALAPFTGAIYTNTLQVYSRHLLAQPALAGLPVERWQPVLQAAADRGLLAAHDFPGFLTLQPILPYFLRSRLAAAGQADTKAAIEAAYHALYDQWGGQLSGLARSKEPQERQLGLAFIGVEYENLRAAVELALAARASFFNPYDALSRYLRAQQDYPRLLALSEAVYARRSQYPADALKGVLGGDFTRCIGDMAESHLKLKHFPEAEAAYLAAAELLNGVQGQWAEPARRQQAVTYHQLGIVAQEQRQWASAEGYYRQALEIYVEFGDRYEQARTYHQLGMVAQEQRQWAQAEGYYRQALALDVESGDRHGQAATYHQLGNVAFEQRQWAQAEHYYQQALEIYVEFGDRYNQAHTYHQLGMVAQEQRQWASAEGYYRQALEIDVEFGDRYSQAITYHQLGTVAQEQRQWAQAEAHYRQALALKIEFGDRYSQASTYHNLGAVAQEQRQWASAEGYYRQALALKIEFGDRHSQARTYHQLGRVAEEQRQWEQALRHYLLALQIGVDFKDEYRIGTRLESLARLWRASGDAGVPAGAARVLGVTQAEAEARLREAAKLSDE